MNNDYSNSNSLLAAIVATPLVIAWVMALPLQSAALSTVTTAALLAWRKQTVGHWWLLVSKVEDSGE